MNRPWWCTSGDIPGLVSEAVSFEALVDRVTAVAPDVLFANGATPGSITLDFHLQVPAYA